MARPESNIAMMGILEVWGFLGVLAVVILLVGLWMLLAWYKVYGCDWDDDYE